MQSIPHGGICLVVRKFSLMEKAVDPDKFQQVTRYLEVYGEDDYITIYALSGGDASQDMQSAFEALGLTYIDDFYAVDMYLPNWLSVGLAFRPQ